MKSSTHDKVEGAAKVLAGKLVEFTGKGIGNPRLETKGAAKKAEGQVQQKVGQIKRVFEK